MKWNDRIARLKLYVLESFRILSIINFMLIALVWKEQYQLSNINFIILLGVAGTITIFFGWLLVELFKEGEQEEVMKKTPQIMEIQESLKRIEMRLK